MKTLAIIPARGGSKGIARKNLRILNGKPLIYYSIKAALNCSLIDYVFVSTEDEEVAFISEIFGASIHNRNKSLSNDDSTIDDVIYNCATNLANKKYNFDIILTIQPTSPLITSQILYEAINSFKTDVCDTLVSLKSDKHLRWEYDNNGNLIPCYSKRVNRQYLPEIFAENGAFVICKSDIIKSGSRFGKKVRGFLLPKELSHDIDDYSDFLTCQSLLARKKLVFVVTGHSSVGLGHVYRCLLLANHLVHYDILFICTYESELAYQIIKKSNYNVIHDFSNNLLEIIKSSNPYIIINDILDTKKEYIVNLKKIAKKVVNFEDLGDGSVYSDLTINALYPSILPLSNNVYSGHNYFCLRDEFRYSIKSNLNNDVSNICILFGGVDEHNITSRVINLLLNSKLLSGCTLHVILGPGYKHELENLSSSHDIMIYKNTSKISSIMRVCDFAFTSAGRTLYELLSLNIPPVVIAQNTRESTHTLVNNELYCKYLGVHNEISDKNILESINLMKSFEFRAQYFENIKKLNLNNGILNVLKLINE